MAWRDWVFGQVDDRLRRRYVRAGVLVVGSGARVLARRIRYRPDCRLQIGASSDINCNIAFDRAGASISIGSRTFIGGASLVAAEAISVGDDVLISWGSTIVDHNSHSLRFSERSNDVAAWMADRKDWSHVSIRPVVIADKVWIGFNVCILKGVTIGEGAVVGAGSVVTKDVPAWTVVAGNPARVLRMLPEDER